MRRVLSLSLLALAQAGCSAIGLTDFPIFECSEHSQCEPLNQDRGIASDACVRYQCAADSRCRLQPVDLDRDGHATTACASAPECGGTIECDDCDDTSAASFPGQAEVCDGVDNDCNLVVDDVAGGGEAGFETVVSGTDSPTWHAYGQPLEGSAVAPVSFGRAMNSYFNIIDRDDAPAEPIGRVAVNVMSVMTSPMIMPGCPDDNVRVPAPTTPVGSGTGPGTCATHEDCSDGVLCNGFELCDPSAPTADPVTGCVTDMPEPACGTGSTCNEERGVCELQLGIQTGCSFTELVTAEYETGRWFGAAKSPSMCGGLLRVGFFTENDSDMRFDPGRNVLFAGDVSRSTSFRGLDPITDSGDCTGLSRPDGEPLGLRGVVMAALPAGGDRLRPQALVAWLVGQDAGPSAVEVIGIWEEEFSGPFWVNATGDGIQQRLDSAAAGDVAPVVMPWTGDRAGYLVAYGAAGGGIALRFVPAFADDDEVLRPAGHTPIGPGVSTRRATDPIADLGAEVILETSGEASGVQLVVGRASSGGAQLGLAWADDDGVRFSVVDFDAAAGSFEGFAPQAVASGAAEEIALGYTPAGLVLPGFASGGAVADESSTGGYVVAWRAGGTTSGARFAELDGARVGPDVMRLGGDLRRLHLYLATEADDAGGERSVPRLVYHDPAAQEFRALDAFCGPPG